MLHYLDGMEWLGAVLPLWARRARPEQERQSHRGKGLTPTGESQLINSQLPSGWRQAVP